MIHLTPEEKKKFKQILGTVFKNDADLIAQFDRAMEAKKNEPGDHQSAVLGLYASLLREIRDERVSPVPAPTGATPGPDLEALRKKFFGPKTFQPKNRG